MAQEFKEVAHLNTDKKKYKENYAKIFGRTGPKPKEEIMELESMEIDSSKIILCNDPVCEGDAAVDKLDEALSLLNECYLNIQDQKGLYTDVDKLIKRLKEFLSE